jgi:hypothetical protein
MPSYFPTHPRNARVVVDADGIRVEDREVLRAGDTMHVPMPFADAERAYRARSARLQDAWRGPAQRRPHDAAGKGPYGVVPSKPDAETAYAGFKQRLAEAWRAPPVVEQPWLKVQPRKYKPGLASYDPGDAVTTFDDDAAQTRRDQAQQRYADRISQAWKEPK